VTCGSRLGGDSGSVVSAAPRFDPRLVIALARLDRLDQPIAETNRQLGVVADSLGIPRPSYEGVRTLVHSLRRGRRRRDPGVGRLLYDFLYQDRPADEVIELLAEPRYVPRRK
jgi:hypothetical protein